MADLASLPIEKLLALEVSSASRFVQKRSEAPASVTVVTADDIKAYGWRTLADILASMRGLHVSNDRSYMYLGARGFLRPGDYNTRFLLLIDGNRSNDGIYDQAAIGSDFALDVDLIERVEFVPGPGSSVYGANAFFGVVNVITRRARDFAGPRVAIETGSNGRRMQRASYGMRSEGGAELLLSATSYRERGPNLYFPEFDAPESNNGIARGRDHDRGEKFFLKGSLGPFTASASHSRRVKGTPAAAYEQVFNDPRSQAMDASSAIDFGYSARLSDAAEFSTRLYWNSYDFQGDYAHEAAPYGLNHDRASSRRWGTEARLVHTGIARHKLMFGGEYARDYRRDQRNYQLLPYFLHLDDRRDGYRVGVYAQDEFEVSDKLLLNAGLRVDRNDGGENEFNPRVALIHRPSETTSLKAIYGSAFRAPNAYERYYSVPGEGGQKANLGLKSEHVRSVELSLEQYLAANTRITVSLFRNRVTDLISQAVDVADGLLVYRNIDSATAHGAELELEHGWRGGARLRTSYSWQRTRDDASGATPPNSPRQMAKLNVSAPLFASPWRAGLETRYMGRRNTLRASTREHWLTNLTISSIRLAPGLELSAGAYNLFDRRYADPVSAEHLQDALQQNGRSFRLKLDYAF